jgi:NAD+ synthase (glutamine-hydrolysing)
VCASRVGDTYAKRRLPSLPGVRRYFTPGQGTCVFQGRRKGVGAVSIGLLICKTAVRGTSAVLSRPVPGIVVINASPFHVGEGSERG